MCMETLSFFIEDKCFSHLWDPIKVSRNGLVFSHLMFADDVVVFAKTDLKNSSSMTNVLDFFREISGPKVSLSKLSVFLPQCLSPL